MIRAYAGWIWARFALEKPDQGWLTSNALRPLLKLVADGHLPARMPGYDALIRGCCKFALTSCWPPPCP